MKVISRNYLAPYSSLKWLVRDEAEELSQATPCQAVIAKDVRFQASSKMEEDLGCAMVAVSDDVEIPENTDRVGTEGHTRLFFRISGIYDSQSMKVTGVDTLTLTPDGAIWAVL